GGGLGRGERIQRLTRRRHDRSGPARPVSSGAGQRIRAFRRRLTQRQHPVASKTRQKPQNGRKPALRILIADDSPDSIDQMSSWIRERWPDTEIFRAQAPDEAVSIAAEEAVENIVLDLAFVVPRGSGVEIARRILQTRAEDEDLRTRILFRTVHAGDPSYLHQTARLINDEKYKPAVWGFVDKGAMPKRLVQNAVEQVFI